MKRFTKNFIFIMCAGVFIITLLANDFFAQSGIFSVQASGELYKTKTKETPSVSLENLSPDEIDTDRFFASRNIRTKGLSDTLYTTSSEDDYADVTTVTTQLPGSSDSSTKTETSVTKPETSALKTETSSLKTETSALKTKTSVVKTTTVSKKNSNDVSNIKNPNYQSPYYIVVYTGSQSVVVYGKDSTGAYNKVVKCFTCSTGNKSATPTRKGVYAIRAKYRWRQLMGGVYGQYSSSISSSYLFHSVPYNAKDPSTLSNSSYDNLGRDVSHGCIRLCVRDCKWIYDNAPIGTQVNVVWTSGPSGAGVPKRKSGSKYSGWDPSDKWAAGNPYFEGVKTTTTTKATTKTKATTTTTKASKTTTTVSTSTTKKSTTASTTAETKTTSLTNLKTTTATKTTVKTTRKTKTTTSSTTTIESSETTEEN